MKNYELTVLLHPDLEMNPDPVLDKIKKIIQGAGGEITKQEDEGKKRLAYVISGQAFALYYYFDISMPSDAPSKISSSLNITDGILRSLLVRSDERRAKYAAKEAAEKESSEDNQKEEKEDN